MVYFFYQSTTTPKASIHQPYTARRARGRSLTANWLGLKAADGGRGGIFPCWATVALFREFALSWHRLVSPTPRVQTAEWHHGQPPALPKNRQSPVHNGLKLAVTSFVWQALLLLEPSLGQANSAGTRASAGTGTRTHRAEH